MKAKHRVKLLCYKHLSKYVTDKFTVVVMEDKKDAAKREYERQGYQVSVL